MKDYQQRVVDEKIVLEEKLEKLTKFLGSETFLALDYIDQFLLSRQREIMQSYANILNERINRFSDSNG